MESDTVYTKKDGIASTFFYPGKQGKYVLKATFPNNPEIYFNIIVKKSGWGYFAIFGLLGGLAIFIFGMNQTAKNLQKIAGSGLKNTIGKVTKNRVSAFIAGIISTFAVQSSSAVSVMLIGFVTAGLMSFTQTLVFCLAAMWAQH